MKICEVLIEYTSSSLDRPFSYAYKGEKDLKPFCRVLVPFNNKNICGFILNVIDSQEDEEAYKQRTGFILKEISEVIDDEPLISSSLNQLATMVADYYFAPLISVYFAMLPPSLKPSLSSKNKPSIAYETYVKPVIGVDYDNLTTRQAEVLYHIIEKEQVKKSELSPSIVKNLLNKAKIIEFNIEKNRLKLENIEKKEDLKLSDEQNEAYKTILNTEKNVILLQGVTGSGKTEVYLQVAKKYIENNKKVLMLVPEISLSYAMVRRFQTRFEKVAILHSDLTPGQRYDEYRRIRNNEVDIVIGARSAIFAPLENIGLIIIDEEHSETYKQEDSLPYYNAIEVAKMRQKFNDCKIVLGSATPSLETKSRALKGVYEQVEMKHRINDLPLPAVKVIDMSKRENIDVKSNLISIPLREAINDRLSKKEQVILLVNRRGYSPYVSCRKCGYVVKCPECEVALTYHYESNKLVCHHCGFEANMISSCPKCHSDKVLKSGFGTEKIELEIKDMFKDARVLRIDSDVTKKRNASNVILKSFENHEADILIGTQIVAKGHDFPCVTLVGIVLADIGLAIPSYRAGERTFDLITQAIGRSGRNKPGEAYIQTYMPSNYIVKTASKQDYMSFYATELNYRKYLQNPPYTFMTLLIVSGDKEDDVINAIYEVEKYLKMYLENESTVSLIGPSELFIKKYLNKYRRKLVIKYKNFETIRPYLKELRMFFNKKGSLTLQINVDPYEDY